MESLVKGVAETMTGADHEAALETLKALNLMRDKLGLKLISEVGRE
jgi:hypothetical protein